MHIYVRADTSYLQLHIQIPRQEYLRRTSAGSPLDRNLYCCLYNCIRIYSKHRPKSITQNWTGEKDFDVRWMLMRERIEISGSIGEREDHENKNMGKFPATNIFHP